MAVSSTTSRKDYEATGGQTVFAYDFYILDQTHIEVYQNSVLKTLTTHYTVSGVGNPAGGNVTLVTGATAGDDLTIIRNVPIKQETDYIDASKFPAETHETALDKLTMIAQQLAEKIGRAATFAVSSLLTAPVLPDGVIGKILRWKTTTELENVDITGSGVISVPVSLAQGGLGVDASTAAGKETARANLGVDGQVVKRLTNKVGAGLSANDVVAISTANDSAVVLGDTAASKQKYAIALETIADNAVGLFALLGIVTAKAQGTIARGQYVQKSATTKAVEDSGTAVGATTDPPAGALGIALAAAGGGTVLILMLPSGGAGGGKPAFLLKPESADMSTSAFPERKRNVGTNWTDYTLDFDPTTNENAYFTVSIPLGVTFTGAEIVVSFRQAAATTGAVVWAITSLTRAEGEAWDTGGNSDVFAAETVPGTAGLIGKVSKTLTVTGWAAGETLLVALTRVATNGDDTLAEDCKFMEAVLRLT